MNELDQIIARWQAARAAAESTVLATVVRVAGSTYRRPGARLLLSSSGERIGAISGGCLEKEVGQKAAWLTRSGPPTVVRYDTSADDDVVFAFGLGCQGVVWALLENLDTPAADYLLAIRDCRLRREPCAVATLLGPAGSPGSAASPPAAVPLAPGSRIVISREGRVLWSSLPVAIADDLARAAAALLSSAAGSTMQPIRTPAGETLEVFIEIIQPPAPVLICGGGFDVPPVVQACHALGWHVTVFDPRASRPEPHRFPGADLVLAGPAAELGRRAALPPQVLAVLMTHNFADDLALLRELLSTAVAYIGVLGPQSRTVALLAELERSGRPLDPAERSRLFGPIGLDIGADTPHEIAAAIVAEMLAVRTARPGGFLRDRGGPIHPPQSAEAAALSALDQPLSPHCRLPGVAAQPS